MFKYKANTVSESAPAGTVVGTCGIHPQKKYALNDHDPGVLGCDERSGEVYVTEATNINIAIQGYGMLVQVLVDDVVVASQVYEITNLSYDTSIPVIDGLPTIVGTAKEGETLTVFPAPVSGVPEPTISLQLQLDAVDYGLPLVDTSFVPTAGDIGGVFTVIQTATNDLGSDTATSAATAAVVAGNSVPVIDGVPTISGAAQVDQVLTATPASVTASPASTLTWKWYADAVEIGGATASTYTPIVGQIGDLITVEQIETNSEGSDTALSAATVAVIAAGGFTAKPVITSNGGGATAAFSLNENISAATTVTATPAYDIVYTITGGADSAKFSINETTGALAFLSAPDFDTPTDSNTDNVYEVEVTATAGGQSDMQAISVTVDEVSALVGTTLTMPWPNIYYSSMVTVGTATPSGEQAYDFYESATTNYHYCTMSLGNFASGSFIFGVEAKANERQHFAINIGGGPYDAVIDLSNGSITAGTESGTTVVTDKGDGWYWIEVPFSGPQTALQAYLNLSNISGQGPSYAGTAGYGVTVGRTWIETL